MKWDCGIYKITNPKGLVYIGKSKNLKSRVLSYVGKNSKVGKLLKESFKIHGKENHTFEVVEYCDMLEINERERFWQLHYIEKTLNVNFSKGVVHREDFRVGKFGYNTPTLKERYKRKC